MYRTSAVQDPLPVTLISFQARAAGTDVVLRWATAQELNSASYSVERSADGLGFETVGTLPARGTTSQRSDYQFLDKGVGRTAGTWYYRLQQLDLDGTSSRTTVSLVRFGDQGVGLATLYPNPLTPETVLSLAALPTGSYTVQVVGMDGRVLLEQVAQGGETLPFASPLLRNGIYLVRVMGKDVSQTLKLVKK